MEPVIVENIQGPANASFVVDASPLLAPAKKPHNLENRIRARSAEVQEADPKEAAATRRAELLQSKIEKLMNRDRHRKRAVRAKQEQMKRIHEESLGRLQKAEEQRKKVLQERESSCASHVNHARKVAERLAQRRQTDILRRKAELQEKLEFVAKRRQKLLFVPRSRLLDPQLLAGDEDFAAQKIQRRWRRSKVAPIIKSFRALGVNEHVPFETLLKRIQSKKVIATTAALLNRVRKMSHAPFEYKTPVRTFLSAFIIVGHTDEIIQKTQEQRPPVAQALIESARSLLEAFGMFLVCCSSYDVFLAFTNELVAFFDRFDEWKFEDVKTVAEGMISHWVHLERLWISVRNHPEKEDWKQGVIEQQKQIVEKITRLGPNAVKLFEKAKEQCYQEFQEMPDVSDSEKEESSDIENVARLSSSPERIPGMVRDSSIRRDSVHTSDSAVPEQASKPKTDIARMLAPFGSELSPEQLAHELSLNPDFELKPRPLSELEERIKTIAKKAFFDALHADLEERKFDRVLGIFDEIKRGLVSMLPENSAVSQQISETIDLDLFRQQIEHGSFQVIHVIEFVVSKMLQLCAPVRDSSIRAILNETDLPTALSNVLDIIDEMKYDLMNYKLKSLVPVLSQYSVDYEKDKFKEALAKSLVSVDKTKDWLKITMDSLKSIAAKRNPEGIDIPENRVKFEDAFNEAYLSLISSAQPVSRETVPETLLLDVERLWGFQNEIQAITIVSVLLMVAKNTVTELRRDSGLVEKMKNDLFVLLKDGQTSLPHLVTFLVSSVEKFLGADEERKKAVQDQFETMVKKILSIKDPIYSLLNRRIMACIKSQLSTGQFKRDAMAKAGLSEVTTEVEALSRKIHILAKHNKQVYSEWYDEILRQLA